MKPAKPFLKKALNILLLVYVVVMAACLTGEGVSKNTTALVFPSAESTALSVQQTYMAQTLGQMQDTPVPFQSPVIVSASAVQQEAGLARVSMTCDPGSAPLNARFISNRVILDGDIHAWYAGKHQAANVVSGNQQWAGDWDLKADFQLGWTFTDLYLVVSVEDEQYCQALDDPVKTNLGDSIEVLIDTNLCDDLTNNSMNDDDFHLRISPGYQHVNGERFVYRVKPAPAGEVSQILMATARTPENLTNYEIQIPWSALGLQSPAAGQMFRFALFVSDNDDPQSNKQETVLSTMLKPMEDALTPTAWTLLVLGE